MNIDKIANSFKEKEDSFENFVELLDKELVWEPRKGSFNFHKNNYVCKAKIQYYPKFLKYENFFSRYCKLKSTRLHTLIFENNDEFCIFKITQSLIHNRWNIWSWGKLSESEMQEILLEFGPVVSEFIGPDISKLIIDYTC